ncbi:hypothetical protein F4V43_08295 [Paenibacillus spiritus]|uniref:Flp pilus assembly protein TadB n=1 Tax=Paenibacillus spiritus TaxID=2496557 RepID=A0A5J5GBR1_9BACL|nr:MULTISPECIES: hypothetical protein [Paenibacillus]KAA9005458.1 hypothetical protein F4V43_08295 [Paenibacillus spiritus]
MILLAKLAAMLSILYLVRVLFYPMMRSVSRSQKKRARQYVKQRKNEKFRQRVRRFKLRLARKYAGALLSAAERARFKKMIDRLDLNKSPEEVRTEQILYLLGALLLTALMLKLNPVLGYLTAIFVILGWLYPVSELERAIERKNKNIALDFPAFYSMVYYQYIKSVNIHLADVLRDYIPNANPDIGEELGVMLDNTEYGEEFALKQLKKRVPLHYVIKFCDIMETRLKGYDNVAQMAYLKNELDGFRVRALEEELERRERSGARIQMALILVLAAYILIYYLFTILGSIKMFQ